MKKNKIKKGAGTLLLMGMICLVFSANTLVVSAQEKEDKVYEEVAVMPEFKDGNLQTFRTWVMQNIKYPENAQKNGIQGTVYAEFIIEKDGSVKMVKITRAVDPSLDKEVIRVIKSSPEWKPGKNADGKIVRVKFALPVIFALS